MNYQSATLNSLLSKYNNQQPQAFESISSDFQSVGVGKRRESLSDPGCDTFQKQQEVVDHECVDQYFDIFLSKVEGENQRYSSEKKSLARKREKINRQMTPIRQKKEQKKSKMKKRGKKESPFNSIEHFTGNRVQIARNIREAGNLSTDTEKFGMKSIKNLGSVRAKRQIEHIINYLENGELPPQYIDKLQALISD